MKTIMKDVIKFILYLITLPIGIGLILIDALISSFVDWWNVWF